MSRGRRHRSQTARAAAPAQPAPGREADTDRLRQSNGSVDAVRRLLDRTSVRFANSESASSNSNTTWPSSAASKIAARLR